MSGGAARRTVAAVLPPLGAAAAVGMFVVLVMGATVTGTGSAEGCGRQWPLCNGRWVPEFAVQAAIEFSHRAVTAVESLLIFGVAVLVLAFRRRERGLVALVLMMTAALLAQAIMGALAVVAPQDPLILALHFGISLLAVASSFLAAVALARPGWLQAPVAASPSVRAATWGLAIYLYALTYTGAYVRHIGAAGSCLGWPLCQPNRTGLAPAANLAHRTGAALTLLLALGLYALYRRAAGRRPDLRRGAAVLIGLLLVQGAAGGYLVLSLFSLGGELLHAAVTGLVFSAAAYLCLAVTLPETARAPELAAAPARRTLGQERVDPLPEVLAHVGADDQV